MRKVLLTGSTGFVGGQVLTHLAQEDVLVRLVVREYKKDIYKKIPNIESVVTTKDLFSEDSVGLNKLCQNIDILIHTAWYVEPGKYLESPLNLGCLNGTISLAKAAGENQIRHFIGLGTCFEYDLNKGVLSTDTPLNPTSTYAAAKTAAYIILSRYFSSTSVNFSWGRLFYLYGDKEDQRRLVAYIKSKILHGEVANLSNGEQIRDFMDVEDAAKVIVKKALGNESGAFNICSGVGLTVREMAERIADQYGRRDLLNFGARKKNLIDPPIIIGIP